MMEVWYKMKREIKFRVWDTVKKQWTFDFYFGLDLRPDPFLEHRDGDDFIFQQYTGLKDKNGKEIYEGDILSFVTKKKFGHQEDGITVFTKPVEFGKFCVNNNSLYVFNGFHVEGNSIEYLLSYESTVAGNIFENEELLK
jgi:uncharacterized phage protein (TIGR01671 family)